MFRWLLVGLAAVLLALGLYGPRVVKRLALTPPAQQQLVLPSPPGSAGSGAPTPLAPGTTDQPLPPSSTGGPSAPRLLPANARSGIQGAWIRPDKRPAMEVLAPLKQAGYTDVFVEAFYHGMTIYPSRVAPQRPRYEGMDKLDEYRQAAARLGLRLHAWFEVLYWAPPFRYRGDRGLLLQHPEWETRDASSTTSSWGKKGMGFADPGVYEVRRTVYDLARELGERYPRVGLHLDYLRYPAGGDYGYHPRTVNAYRRLSGLTPTRFDPRWYAYRQELLTQVANGMSRAYREAGGVGLVTAAVNPNYPFHKAETLQVWPRWTEVDVFIPMAYSTSITYLKLLSRYVRARSPKPVWMGVLVGEDYPSLRRQVAALKHEGYSNFVVFGLR